MQSRPMVTIKFKKDLDALNEALSQCAAKILALKSQLKMTNLSVEMRQKLENAQTELTTLASSLKSEISLLKEILNAANKLLDKLDVPLLDSKFADLSPKSKGEKMSDTWAVGVMNSNQLDVLVKRHRVESIKNLLAECETAMNSVTQIQPPLNSVISSIAKAGGSPLASLPATGDSNNQHSLPQQPTLTLK